MTRGSPYAFTVLCRTATLRNKAAFSNSQSLRILRNRRTSTAPDFCLGPRVKGVAGGLRPWLAIASHPLRADQGPTLEARPGAAMQPPGSATRRAGFDVDAVTHAGVRAR